MEDIDIGALERLTPGQVGRLEALLDERLLGGRAPLGAMRDAVGPDVGYDDLSSLAGLYGTFMRRPSDTAWGDIADRAGLPPARRRLYVETAARVCGAAAAARSRGGILVDPALEAKAAAGGAYGEFVGAVSSACASPEADLLGLAGCGFSENRDLENPAWLKLILRADFAGGDFYNRRDRRMRLREIVDGRIAAARRASGDPGGIDEMTGRFFIVVRW